MSDSNTNDLEAITLGEARKFIKVNFMNGRVPMIWGPPGMGKSEMIHALAKEYTTSEKPAKVIDVRLSLWDPTDVKGIPYFDSVSQTMKWAPAAELPSAIAAEEYSKVILFLDEINTAAPSTQAAAYQLILDRRIGQYVLPDNVSVIAAGNRESDKGVTYKMAKPLANRFVHYEVKVNFDEWWDWAIDAGIHVDVLGFLRVHQGKLDNFNPKSAAKAFNTPRTWAHLSETMHTIDEIGGFNFHEETMMAAGHVGHGLAIEFNAHRELTAKLPDPELVFSGDVKKLETTDISAKYSYTIALIQAISRHAEKVDSKVLVDSMANMVAMMEKSFSQEMVIMGLRLIMKSKDDRLKQAFRKSPSYRGILQRHGSLISELM